jgi:serine protease Do
MKKIILLALAWPLFSYYPYAQEKQKDKTKSSNSQEIIIIKSGDKEKKLTIETKDGEVFINGKPASEYKDGDVNVVKQKFKTDKNFLYAPGADKFNLFDKEWGKNKGFLGVTTEKADGGARITDVSKGSAAEKAGLKEGDIITKIGDKNINDEDDVFDAVNARKPKEDVTISYKRDGKAGDVKATLAERSTFSKSFSFNGKNWDSGFNFTMPKIPAMGAGAFAYSFGRGKLGLRIEDTDNDTGAKITDVNDGSVAEKAGLKENDIITEVNGKKVKDVNDVRKELGEVKDKTSYNIKAKRNGSDMNFEIKIPKKINKADL